MTEKYTETLERLTASDQVFAFHEELHDSGITYREFTNAELLELKKLLVNSSKKFD